MLAFWRIPSYVYYFSEILNPYPIAANIKAPLSVRFTFSQLHFLAGSCIISFSHILFNGTSCFVAYHLLPSHLIVFTPALAPCWSPMQSVLLLDCMAAVHDCCAWLWQLEYVIHGVSCCQVLPKVTLAESDNGDLSLVNFLCSSLKDLNTVELQSSIVRIVLE